MKQEICLSFLILLKAKNFKLEDIEEVLTDRTKNLRNFPRDFILITKFYIILFDLQQLLKASG